MFSKRNREHVSIELWKHEWKFGSLEEREMLWEHMPQARVSTALFVKRQQSPKIFFFTWEKNVTNAKLSLRDPGNPKWMDFHKFYFYKLAFMLNVTSNSENETFFKLHEFVSLPKLESSLNVTSKVIWNRIKARKSKSREQYDCKFFFRLDGTCNSMI